MKIPRDLKPGDRLYYSKTEYATVRNRRNYTSPYWESNGAITAFVGDKIMFYDLDGTEQFNDTPPIIRIERIASAPAKVKRVKVDTQAQKDAAWLLNQTLCETGVRRDYYARRLRAIARRLNGGKS